MERFHVKASVVGNVNKSKYMLYLCNQTDDRIGTYKSRTNQLGE